MQRAVLAFLTLSLPAVALADEATLRHYFEGMTVVVKLDMPGSSTGVDVRPGRYDAVDFPKIARDLKQYGPGVRAGESIMITKVHVKNDHIEFHLGGGGFGTFGDYMASGGAPPSAVYEGKSKREKELEHEIDRESDPARRRRLKSELDDLRRERRRDNAIEASASAQARAEHDRDERERRAQSGSRFNIRYDGGLPPDAASPEAVMAALQKYLEFPRDAGQSARGPRDDSPGGSPADLQKGMTVQQVEELLGPATHAATEHQGSLVVATRTYFSHSQRVVAKFANDVLLEYTISSK